MQARGRPAPSTTLLTGCPGAPLPHIRPGTTGDHVITAADTIPDDLHQAVDAINGPTGAH